MTLDAVEMSFNLVAAGEFSFQSMGLALDEDNRADQEATGWIVVTVAVQSQSFH